MSQKMSVLKDGEYLFLYPNGIPLISENIQSGVREGIQRLWHENGVLAAETHWHQGRMHGPFRIFDAKGQLQFSGIFKEGELVEVEPPVGMQNKPKEYFRDRRDEA